MAAAQEDFFKNDTLHGLVKRIMYKKYLQAYVAKTQQAKTPPSGLKTFIIDGFSGAGRYGDSVWPIEIEKYGSPMIALLVVLQFFCNKFHGNREEWDRLQEDVVKELNKKNNTIPNHQLPSLSSDSKVYLYFVEKSRKNFTQLVNCVEAYLHIFLEQLEIKDHHLRVNIKGPKADFYITHECFPLECHISNCEFKDFPPPIMPQFATRLAFIDPFGYSQTPMEQVSKYLGTYSEVLINFMSSYVNRFCGTRIDQIAALYGIDLPARQHVPNLEGFVRNIVRMGQNIPPENAKNCTRSYITHVKEKTGAEYALMFEMRGKTNNVIYHLIHFTSHWEAFKTMKESMNRCSQYEGECKMSDYKIEVEEIPLTLGNEQKNAVVAQEVYTEFKGRKDVPIDDVEEFVYKLHAPYVFRKGILRILEESKLITSVRAKMATQRKRTPFTFPDFKSPDNDNKWILTFANEVPDDQDLAKYLERLTLKS